METVILEQAKKIDELGIEIKTTWCWLYNPIAEKFFLVLKSVVDVSMSEDAEIYAAPTVVEMLDRMPDRLIKDGLEFEIIIQKGSDNVYFPNYYNFSIEQTLWDNPEKHSTLSETVGDMFIWCAENEFFEKSTPT